MDEIIKEKLDKKRLEFQNMLGNYLKGKSSAFILDSWLENTLREVYEKGIKDGKDDVLPDPEGL